MSAHDSSLYVPSDIGQLRAVGAAQTRAAQLTVVEYADRERLPRGELVDLLDMLGINAGPYAEQETTNG